MNKIYGIICMSIACATVQADKGYNLDQITEAINASDIAQVKTHWRRLDTVIESSSEKLTVLESLIVSATQLAEDTKSSVAGGVTTKDYKKIAGGVALYIASIGAVAVYAYYNGSPLEALFNSDVPANEKIRGMGVFTACVLGGSLGGQLIRTGLGWEGPGQQPIVGSGRSKAAIILAYLESLLQELKQENHKS